MQRLAYRLLLAAALFIPNVARADLGDCSQPVTSGSEPVVTDCLFILQSAVGLLQCEPACVCDVDGSTAVSVLDAQLCLASATGQDVTKRCPCEPTTTTTLIVGTFTLTVDKSGSGTGTVTSTPAGISCGNQCAAEFSDGSEVDLVAAPDAGSQFDRWKNGPCDGNAGCTLTMTKNRSVTAKFVTTTLPPPACPFTGVYTGTFRGDDRGTFDVNVDVDCKMDGSFFSTVFNEADAIDGDVDPVTGEVDAVTEFGRTHVTGEMRTDGSASGDWRNPDGSRGTWSGNKN